MNKKTDIVFIEHILDSIISIKEFSKNMNKEELFSNRLKQSAIVREIEIIREAVKNISESLKIKYKQVEWKNIASTRDKMIHNYFGINLDIIWGIINDNIPVLEKQIKKIKERLIKEEQ